MVDSFNIVKSTSDEHKSTFTVTLYYFSYLTTSPNRAKLTTLHVAMWVNFRIVTLVNDGILNHSAGKILAI